MCTPLLHKLHWQPLTQCIKCKACGLCLRVITISAPFYLSKLLLSLHTWHTLVMRYMRLFAMNHISDKSNISFLQFFSLWASHLK